MTYHKNDLGAIILEEYLGGFPPARFLLKEDAKAEKEAAAKNIIRKVIASIKFKHNKLELKDIEASAGNFLRLKNKDYIVNTVQFFENFQTRYPDKDIERYVRTLNTAIKNLSTPTLIKKFEEGYQNKTTIIQLLYSSVCLNLIMGVSSILAFLVNYIKEPDGSYLIAFAKSNEAEKGEVELLINNLEKFNELQRTGKLELFFKSASSLSEIPAATSEDAQFTSRKVQGSFLKESLTMTIGSIGVGIFTGILITLLIINMIRLTIYVYYRLKIRIGVFFSDQADLLELNSTILDGKKDKSTIEKQKHYVLKLRKASDFFRGEMKDALSSANKDIKNEEKYFQNQTSASSTSSNSSGALI
jgi:hypothetical protein